MSEQLEDQSFPKKCGHLDGKKLISKNEMEGKIQAALDARTNQSTRIIARTDARAVEGFSQAIDRARAYKEAGADVLFIEAPRSMDEMRKICAEFSHEIPLLANMVEGGKTPIASAKDLDKLGYKIVIFPGGAVRAISHHMQGYYSGLLTNGNNDKFSGKMHDFSGLNDLIGTKYLIELGAKYEDKGNK